MKAAIFKTYTVTKKVMVVSQIGFDDVARKFGLETETAENIKVSLIAPKDILSPETFDAEG